MEEKNELFTGKVLKVDEKLEVSYCIDDFTRDEQIRHAIKRVQGRIEPGDTNHEPVAIVCFGPSLSDTWEEIKNFKTVFSCSGSHKYLVERGIIPTYHVEVDPRPHKVQLIGQPHKDVTYLIASTCHPAVFDLLEGYKVKLWHIFDPDEETCRVLPRGEWSLTGGCGVGLRAMVAAAFLGYKNQHIFGMDGCEGKEGNKHAAFHPNEPKKHSLVEYPEGSGTFYRTTESLLVAAKQTFYELDQLPDLKVTFHGEGLVQAMAKDYVPSPVAHKFANILGVNLPKLISDEMRDLNEQLHRERPDYGIGGAKHMSQILKICQALQTPSVLDYGCGKGTLARAMPFPIWEYDPAIPEKSELPRPADIVVCTDVLEHIEPELLRAVLEDLRRCTKLVGYFAIHTGPAKKTYADGRNTHLIQKDAGWWASKLEDYFEIGKVFGQHPEYIFLVGPKKVKVKYGDVRKSDNEPQPVSNRITVRSNSTRDVPEVVEYVPKHEADGKDESERL